MGEKPQIWIEVDLTKPVVELQSVLVGQGEHKGKLSISWLARDKNLGKAPIKVKDGSMAVTLAGDGCIDGTSPQGKSTTTMKFALTGTGEGFDIAIEANTKENRTTEPLK